jgi:2,3,4,5-tetrahydropyridine-2-carboxylate N-succinyltransferase
MFKKEQSLIDKIWLDKSLMKDKKSIDIINKIIDLLDSGKIRVSEYKENEWNTNPWIKKAILLYFSIRKNAKIECGDIEFYDKIPLKKDFQKKNIRSVPISISRYGSFIAKNVILMPSYINIGAYVDSGTMIDTWATVGSCAQIGKNVHISGGVGIGGVLEPIQNNPVIIEDNCFVGSRSIVVEGTIIKKEAVLGAGVVITSSTKIIDVSNTKETIYKGEVPERSVVIPGSYTKRFKSGTYNVPCCLIIGKRKESTDKKTSLNNVLRDFNVSL